MRKNCSSDQEKIFEIREFAKILRSLKEFIQKVRPFFETEFGIWAAFRVLLDMRNLQEMFKKNILLPKVVLTFHCLN